MALSNGNCIEKQSFFNIKMNYLMSTRKLKCLTILLFFFSFAHSQSFNWAKRIGGTSNDFGLSLVLDSNKNVYSVGVYTGTVDFNPGSPIFNLTGQTLYYDGYVSKLDSNGNFLWAKNFIGPSNGMNSANPICIDIDEFNNIYLFGAFGGTIDFDPGPSVFNLTSTANGAGFVCKLNSNGNFIWAKSFEVSYNNSGVITGRFDPKCIKIDSNENVLISGNFGGTVDFNPSTSAVFNLTGPYSQTNQHNAFICKLNSSGNFIWAKKIESTRDVRVFSMDLDINNNPIFTGYLIGTADFDPGTPTFNVTSDNNGFWLNAFWCKLDINGNFSWFRKIGSAVPQGITVDNNNNILTTGYFGGILDFNPGSGTDNLTAIGSQDAFVLKLNNSGNFTWAKNIGGSSSSEGRSIHFDNNSNIYFTGEFRGTVDFDPNNGIYNLISNGVNGEDLFICKLNPNGNFIWARKIGGIGNEKANDLKVDNNQNIYLTGDFQDIVDFNPNNGIFNLTGNGLYQDIFIAKIGNCLPSFGVDFRFECNSYTWINGITYTSNNNTATHTIIGGASNGCDSIVTLNLVILNSAFGIDSIIHCNSYTWINGITYTSNNNTATHTIIGGASNGCDSIVTLNLNILNNAFGIDSIIQCNSYTWINGLTYSSNNNTATHTIIGGASNGCDSIVTLNLVILNSAFGIDSIIHCNSYTWINGITYTSNNNTATHTIIGGANNGCDSIVSLNLTINNISDLTLTTVGTSIISNNSNATYQWLDCDNNYSFITNENNQTFTPNQNGNYAVELTQGPCIDTTLCTNISISNTNIYDELITIHPNPNQGKFYVNLYHNQEYIFSKIFNSNGTLCLSQKDENTNMIHFNLNLPNGVYIIHITSNKKNKTYKLTIIN
jgi:hypothetical protein